MKKFRFFISSALFILVCTSLYAEKMTIAILDLKSGNVPKIITNAVTDIVRSEFVNIENFRVTERGQMDKIIEEQKLQLSGLLDDESAVKLGELLSAQKVVLGEVNSLDEAYIITLRIVDVETAESEFSAREKADNADELDSKAVTIARDLAQRVVTGNKEYFTALSPAGYYLRSIVPGWGQFYVDKPVKGIIFSSLFAGSAAYAAVNYLGYKDKEEAYQDVPLGSSDFNSKYDDYEKAGNFYNYSLIITGGVYLLHWADILFLSKPDFDGSESREDEEISPMSGFFIAPAFTEGKSGFSGLTIGFRNQGIR